MTMGISDLIPGVSGGTIALVLGIYQNLLAAINGLFTRQWKKHLLFLLPLGIGIGAALLAVSHLVEWLLAEYPQPTFFFFLGLIIGIIPKLLHDIEFRRSFTPVHYGLLLIGALIVGLTVFIKEDELAPVMTALTTGDYALLFFAGWLASSAMILPGISGSFIFLLFGVYPTVVNALSTINFPVIITVGAGIAIGLIVTSRFIAWLLRQFRVGTYAVIIGFIIGSIIVIYPGIGTDRFLLLVSVLTFLIGAGCAFLLSRFEQKKQL
ncbi:DUF368 domain-containing protein [Alkalihalobacillus oceani]|uniref:DUF368 domain-containing protein n=1 Tax=Halalkalibacter oceani TaxID=1653776 RepID=UPI00203A3A43|nr:DUF368 domain-containing protein [Halalkalibacter oceani]MCM3761405.1 DUF368 domain-containing protein [Halalkalibacter oceani]